jgi:hypothetical protein
VVALATLMGTAVHSSSTTTAQVTPIEEIPPGLDDSLPVASATTAQLSRRGETVVARDAVVVGDITTIELAFAEDRTGQRTPVADTTRWTATSGDGCTLVSVRNSPAPPEPGSVSTFGTPPPPTVIVRTGCTIDAATGSRTPIEPPTEQSFDPIVFGIAGRPAVDLRGAAAFIPTAGAITRIDLTSGATSAMPIPSGFVPTTLKDNFLDAVLVDVSPDGRYVAAAVRPATSGVSAIAVWDVTTNGSRIVSPTPPDTFARSESPSISHDGRFVAYVSDVARVGDNRVYVTEVDPTLNVVRSTAPDLFGTDIVCAATMSEDATQIVYVHGPEGGGCDLSTHTVSVVWSSAAGFADGTFERELIEAPSDEKSWRPELSGSGRFVAWDIGFTRLPRTDDETQVVRIAQRDAALSVDPIPFGEIPAGSSAVAPTAVRNNGPSSLMPTRFATTGPFEIAAGGTCTSLIWLSPLQSCTVNVRYNAPIGGGNSTGQITVSEVGHLPISATSSLTGSAPGPTVPPDITVPTTDPPVVVTTTDPPTVTDPPTTTLPPVEVTTTLPPVVVTTTIGTTTSTTTAPDPDIETDPSEIDFGPVGVGETSDGTTVTVTNTGNMPVTPEVSIGGDHPGDYVVVDDGCTTRLNVGATCSFVVRFVPTSTGDRPAVVTVQAGDVDATIELDGAGRTVLRLQPFPEAAFEGDVVTVVGSGFAPEITQTVEVLAADADTVLFAIPVRSDESGVVRTAVAELGELPLGNYFLSVAPDPVAHDGVIAAFGVVTATVQPQAPTSSPFGDLSLVQRR